MNIYVTYLIIAAILVAAELVYFRIAYRFNIIDKTNERSSHTKVVIRGGGVIFPIGQWHTVRSLESGTVILECKDGPYEPLQPEDMIVR